METYDYVNRTVKSLSRPLTAKERSTLVKARERWHLRPRDPRTKAENAKTRALVAAIYEDGGSRNEISEVTGWSVLSIAQMIRAARRAGDATGQRRYIPLPVKETVPAPPSHRNLTAKETEWLVKQAARLPRNSRDYYRWDNPTGDRILAKILGWAAEDPPVLQEDIANALGIARQAVAVLISRNADKPQRGLVRVDGLTDEQYDRLADAFAAARPWGPHRIRWASQGSAKLITVIGQLHSEGVSVDTLAAAMRLDPSSVTNGLSKYGQRRPVATASSVRLPSGTAASGRTLSAKPAARPSRSAASRSRGSRTSAGRKATA